MALWNGVSQVASIAQLAGVDAGGLISMIVEAAKTVKRNRETCQMLARRVRMIGDLLQQLQRTQLMQYMDTRVPVEQFEETLRHTYILISSCQDSNYLNSCFMGGRHADQLREVEQEIAFYLQLFPLISFVDQQRTISAHKSLPGQIPNIGELVNHTGGRQGAPLLYFSFFEILSVADNLSERSLIRRGEFGSIYKGNLSNGLDIMVKRYCEPSIQGPDQFGSEIELIPNLRHKSIITLLGFCIHGGEKIFVYEYMPNNCLASIIRDEAKRKLLNWSERLQIIKAIADGLAYLQGNSHMCIIHRDIKPSNILLDHEMNPKISYFGLAMKLVPNTTTEVTVMGTYGYADPEYITTGKISEKRDVYSFGVILLELISGKLCQLYMFEEKDVYQGLQLPEYARRSQKRWKLYRLIDSSLQVTKHDRAQIRKCFQVALLSTEKCPQHRPTISEVVRMLPSIRVVRQ